jgi:hypothetical protein
MGLGVVVVAGERLVVGMGGVIVGPGAETEVLGAPAAVEVLVPAPTDPQAVRPTHTTARTAHAKRR